MELEAFLSMQSEPHISSKNDHISVCICTYKRSGLLKNLLNELLNQITFNLFTYSIVVVDNDYLKSAKDIVSDFNKTAKISIAYYVEPEQNIALARNKAVSNANGDYIAFIDDDEIPENNWLLTLYKAINKYKAEGVLGPVKPHFEIEPPQWIIRGKLFERKSFNTGMIIRKPEETRTGNVLLTKKIFNNEENLFNPNFGKTGGEDIDFFRRTIEKGYIFIWCEKAMVYEKVPPERFKRSYFLKSALLRGMVNSNIPSINIFNILKSLIAFSIYTLMLPILFLIRYHLFMKYLIKDCDHAGKLMGLCGIKIIKERSL